MFTSKSPAQRLAWNRKKQPIVIPDWLHTYARSWCNAGAKSVYLFGSRSNGYYLPDSDWDIAIVHENEQVKSAIRDTDIRDLSMEEVNEIHLTAEEICRQAQKQPNIASEIISSKLIEGAPLIMPRKHQPDREELRMHLAETFISTTTTLTGINDEWLWNDKEKQLDKLADNHTESNSAYAAERLVKSLCCIYEQEYEMVHKITDFIRYLPEDYESSILKMNGTTDKLHISPYRGAPMESCQDSLNRLIYTLDLFDKMVRQGDIKLTEEECTYVREKHAKRTVSCWDMPSEKIHPDVSTVKLRLDRTIEGLFDQVARDINEDVHPSKKGGQSD